MNVLTTKEVAAKLNISQRQVQTLIQRGRLPAKKIGRDYVISEADLKLVGDRKLGRPPNPKEEQGVKGSKNREAKK